MALHLIKLCVGVSEVGELADWARQRRPIVHTRQTPKRATEILEGGSLYWVIKGQIAARERILGLEPFMDKDGIGRCKIWLDGIVVAVAPRPMRAFQGWRYYPAKDAPADIGESGPGLAAMPEGMRRELASLGLL